MENIYKSIRAAAGCNQEEFAEALGTTPISINRWENGKTEPNRMAQKQILCFCEERGMDLAEMIIRGKEYGEPSEDMILYHASRGGIEGEIAPISRKECDFGPGFYMGTGTLSPLTLVCTEKSSRFYTLSLDTRDLKILNLEDARKWAVLIAYHRGEMEDIPESKIYRRYSRLTKGYDLVIGPTADDRIYTKLSRFFRGEVSERALEKCVSALKPEKQVAAISEKACSQIKILKEESLSELELTVLEDMSIRRRREGIRLTDEVIRDYRHKGLFFDEIKRELLP